MKSTIKTIVLQVNSLLMVMCFVYFSSCSKKDIFETSNDTPTYHDSYETRACESELTDYKVTADMILRFLMGFDCYKDSILSIRSYPSEENNLLFVVNFNKGWKLFPSDSRFGVVLAESEDGTLDLSQEIENENFRVWLADIMNQIEVSRCVLDSFGEENVEFWNSFKARNMALYRKEIDENLSAPTRSLTPGEPIWGKVLLSTSTTTTIIGNKNHLLQTKWGQNAPWNMSMPLIDSLRSVSGCAAVAIAQVLYYYHNWTGVPSGLYHSISLSQFDSNKEYDLYDSLGAHHVGHYQQAVLNRTNYVYNSSHWEEMPLTNTGGTSTQYQYVSDLMLDVGVRIGTYYSPWKSSVTSNSNSYFDISSCFFSVSWAQYQSGPDELTVLTGLEMNEPTIITSLGEENNTTVGHSWVIDGYQKRHLSITNNYAWYPFEDIPDDEAIFDIKNEDYLLSLYPDLYSGMPVIEYINRYNNYYRMNWGWNGLYDSGFYSTWASTSWLDTYSQKKGIHYHMFPRELLIQ